MSNSTLAGYILIADDDVDDIEILTTALNEANSGLEVLVADNGKTVLERLETLVQADAGTLPCVLVMDMNMPKMDGRETVVALKSNAGLKNIPILLFSTAKNKTDELFAEKWGVHFYQKPDSIQGLNDIAHFIITICHTRTDDVQIEEINHRL